MTPDQIVSIVVALLSAEPAQTSFPDLAGGGTNPAFPVTIEACPRPLPPAEVEGKTVICGRVDLPENHDKPEGPRIDLAFAILKARTESPVADPVVYLHGGPGGGAVRDLAGIVAPLWDSYRARRDVVTFDQRAAGISSDMVTCFGTFGANIVDLFQAENMDEAAQQKLFSDCIGELKSGGRDLTAYNTVQNARDVQALMQALGYAEYNIYGVSYGTKLALEVMRSAPEGLRSVVIDSVFQPNARAYDTNILPVQEGIQQVIDQCTADSACAAAYPDLEATILRVGEKLRLNPIPAARGRDAVDVNTLISLFEGRNSYGHWPETTAHIPLIVTEWDRGETRTWDMLSSGGTAKVPTSAELLQPYLGKLTPDQRGLAQLVLDNASEGKTQDWAIYQALQTLSDSLARSAQGVTTLATRFDQNITDAILRTQSKEEMTSFVVAYAALAPMKPDRALLRALVQDHLPSSDIPAALAILDQLTDGDVAQVFANVSGEARAIYAPIVAMLALMVIACQEDMPFNSREGMQKVVDGVKFPFLKQSTYVDSTAYDLCPFIPPALPMANFHDPVVSDIPTLVLYGFNDTQTSTEEAKLAAASLTNAQIQGFPEAGHGALIFSQCAKDIGLAYIERPDQPVNSACIAGLHPKFVLPPSD